MRILSNITKASVSIAHEPMPGIGKCLRDFFSAIFFHEILEVVVVFTRIMCQRIIIIICWHESIWSTDADKTFLLFFVLKSPRCNIEIEFRSPISWNHFRIIADSAWWFMRSNKTPHITYET